MHRPLAVEGERFAQVAASMRVRQFKRQDAESADTMRACHLLLIAATAVSGIAAIGCHRPFRVAMTSPLRVATIAPVEMEGDVVTRTKPDNQASPVKGRPVNSLAPADCGAGVAIIDVDGVLLNRNFTGIGSMGENPLALFREKLTAAGQDPRVAAVVLRINSPGGSVTASDIMRRDLMEMKRQTGLPVVACVMDHGCGGAYLLATACDQIVAHPTSIVGSVAVILNLYDMQDVVQNTGGYERAIRSGDRVDAGSPLRAIDPEEKAMLEQIAKNFHRRAIDMVLRSRTAYHGQPDRDFDGRIFTADRAAELGLIDQVGYLDEATALAANLAGLPTATPPLMLYRRENDRANSAFDITPNRPIQTEIVPLQMPILNRATLPKFLYIWQVDPLLERVGT